MTTEPRIPLRGHLYTAQLDKRRPVLIVSPNARNEHASDVIVVPCSTRLRNGPTHVLLRRGEGGLAVRSVLKCEQVTTLPRFALSARPIGGTLSPRRMAQVEQAVLRAIGVPVGY
jgi:mRNA interferase MazF